MATLPPFTAVIVAAGKGLRAGGAVPKQFARWRGKPLVRHSAEALLTQGAASVVRAQAQQGRVRQVEVDDAGTVTDIDTVQDLERAAKLLAARG